MKMSKAKITCTTYGGKIGWLLRKNFSKYTSKAYLEFQYQLRKRIFKEYIALFSKKQGEESLFPCLISIETINRCNSTCEFCPANRNAETRPFAKMEKPLFEKIIKELKNINYKGYLNLYVNNEPFMDNRIEEWYQYAKKELPNAKMLLYTNGTLLTKEKFIKVAPYIDKMIINNYADKLIMHKNISEIYEFVKKNPKYWDKDINIQIRYIREILSNRAGSAPNRANYSKSNKICIMPFTDFTIYPDGSVGLCCNDALEKTNLGNVREHSISEIWKSTTYSKLRSEIGSGRNNYAFCKGCDFVDAGIRNKFMIDMLKSMHSKDLETKVGFRKENINYSK